jgi:hypothetical protein
LPAAVSNRSPLILYAKIERLDLLHAVFSEVLIPPAVWVEVVEGGSDRAGASEVSSSAWIKIRELSSRSQQHSGLIPPLDLGESEAIMLAQELRPDYPIILDDLNARRIARSRGLEVIGSASVLLRAKRRGIVPSIAPLVDQLEAAGLYLSESLYRDLLLEADELL